MSLFAASFEVFAEEAEAPLVWSAEYVQVWLGRTEADNAWSLDDSEGNELVGDYDDLLLGGGVGQRLWGSARGVQYGYEGGGLVSWKNDDVEFAGTSPGLVVAVETELVYLEVFMGGVVALQPTRWLRLFASAGPSIAWGHVSGDDADDEDGDNGSDGTTIIITGPNGFVVIDGDDENDVSFALYGRAGLEFQFANGMTLGASVRYARHEFDFGSRGELEFDEVQWFLTLGGRF